MAVQGIPGRARLLLAPATTAWLSRFNTAEAALPLPPPDGATDEAEPPEAGGPPAPRRSPRKEGLFSGERQLQVLREIVAHTDHRVYLLDEWDANLDAANRSAARALVDTLAGRALVVEVSHRDRG